MIGLRRIMAVSVLIFLMVKPLTAVCASGPLSDVDVLWTRSALKAAASSQWKTAGRFAARIKNPIAKKLLAWQQLSQGAAGITFAEVDAFLKENSDWPGRRSLLRQAERLLPLDMAAEDIFVWFGGREPASAAGRMRLGAAHIVVGETGKGREMIRRAWIDGNFSKSDAKVLYRRFRRYFNQADHIARMDRLLWDGKVWAARRLIYKVPRDWQRLAQARYSLRRRTGNVDYLISKVPNEMQKHLGLVYERLRWRRRKGKDSAFEMLKALPDELPRPELWWREKASLARLALRKGHITQAYNLAKSHGLQPGSAAYADAEWLAGWIALRFLKEHAEARTHFKRMHAAVEYPISRARAAYWAGRAAEAQKGETASEVAITWYRKAAAHPLTYHGQLAFGRLKPNASLTLPASEFDEISKETAQEFFENELVGVVEILHDVGQHELMWPFIRKLYSITGDPGWRGLTGRLARVNGRADLAVRVAKRAVRDGMALLDLGYPTLEPPALPKTATSRAPEVSLTLAVIRQESAFRIDAKSHAQARGLMQIIPPTARRVSKGLRLRYSKSRLVSDQKFNLILGQSYLGDLIEDYKGSYVLALAAYNAGPQRVKRWIKAHGDPRVSEIDAIDWIEMIPFSETRNYVQRVLENLQIYRLRLAETEVALGIAEDLHF